MGDTEVKVTWYISPERKTYRGDDGFLYCEGCDNAVPDTEPGGVVENDEDYCTCDDLDEEDDEDEDEDA